MYVYDILWDLEWELLENNDGTVFKLQNQLYMLLCPLAVLEACQTNYTY